MSSFDEEHLGELLSALPPAPDAWVRSAKEIPRTRAGVEKIVERAEADDEYRRRVVADPEAALEAADVAAHADAVEILRRKLNK
jgi:NADPH-dependent 2,4-dienoyl-CoA reductase/sulfur reductase-like enzyme